MLKGLSKLAIKYGLIPLAYWILRLYFLTIRMQIEGEEGFRQHLARGGKAIVAIFHQRILIVMGYARRFGDFAPSVMISQSRDGEMIASVYKRLRFRPFRGSSSQGGKKALAEMIADLALNPLAVHVVDGPQGPRGVIKMGLISLARHSGAPIFPLYISVDRAWVLQSWDRFLVPKPFCTVYLRWDEPIIVAADLSDKAHDDLRLQVEARMRRLQEEQDLACGWRRSLLA